MKHRLMNFKELDRLFRYDPETGEIRNKIDRGGSKGRIAKAGDIATSKMGKGYLQVALTKGQRQIKYNAHRLAWLLYYKEDPGDMEIDHIDQDITNNRISNLRLVDHQRNMENKNKYKNNTSGFTGVSWNKKLDKWQVRVGGDWIGAFDDLELAGFVAEQVREKLGYHENHGA